MNENYKVWIIKGVKYIFFCVLEKNFVSIRLECCSKYVELEKLMWYNRKAENEIKNPRKWFLFMNEEVENLINKMLPHELERVEKFISMLLNNKREQRKTNLEYLNCEKAVAVYVRN